eukprot:357902-Chlamydomonas_euryale.AAC.3
MPLRLDINGATFVIFAQATAPLAAAAVGAVGVASVAASLAAGSQRLPVNMRLLCRQGFLLHTCVWLLLLPLLLPSLQHLLGRARRLGLRVRWWQLLSTQLQVQGSQLLHHVVHHGQQGTAPRLAQVHVRVERRVSTGRCLPGCRLLPRRWVGAACQRHRDNATGGLHVAQLRRPLAAAGAALPPKVDGNGHAAAVHLVPPARGDVQRIPGCQRRMLSKRKRTPAAESNRDAFRCGNSLACRELVHHGCVPMAWAVLKRFPQEFPPGCCPPDGELSTIEWLSAVLGGFHPWAFLPVIERCPPSSG